MKMADSDVRVLLPPSTESTASRADPAPTVQPNTAANNSPNNITNGTSRPNIITGKLPDDFLRLDGPPIVQAGMPAVAGPQFMPTYYQKGGILTITISQARLAKNYGLSRMDPYCRIRCGNSVYETPTAYNGAKNPRWNKTFSMPLPEGVNRMYIELYDECSFSPDERIAWGLIMIKDEVLTGESVDDWYSLSGKQGDDKEGMINIMMQHKVTSIPAPAPMYMQPMPMMIQYGAPMAYGYSTGVTVPPAAYPQPRQPAPPNTQQPALPVQHPPVQHPPTYSAQDFKTIKDMFPDMDEEIINSVLQSSGGDMDTAVNHLLSMTTS